MPTTVNPTSAPLYAVSPETLASAWYCATCGNRTHFVGIDDNGYGGPDACQPDCPQRSGGPTCNCVTMLVQPLHVLHTGEVEHGLYFGGGQDSEIGEYTRIVCGQCGQWLYAAVDEQERNEASEPDDIGTPGDQGDGHYLNYNDGDC